MGLPIEDHQLDRFHGRTRILDGDALTLWYYPELRMVHHQMHKTPTSEQFRELLTRGADLVERYGAPKWLSDDRGNTVLRPQDEAWSHDVWLPRVLRGGFKFWAIVMPQAAIGKLNMRRLSAEHAKQGIVSAVRENPAAAFEWLQAQSLSSLPARSSSIR